MKIVKEQMGEEFNLSKEIEWWGDVNKYNCPENQEILRIGDVKEFIKKDKLLLLDCTNSNGIVDLELYFKRKDKLAGKGLIK